MLQLASSNPLVMNNPELWNAVLNRDISRDGTFVFAVRSTGIYCRPSCAARRPRREQVSFFQMPEAAERAGFRACRRCHPRRARANDPQIKLAREICRTIDQHNEEPLTLDNLSKETGVNAHRLQRTFKEIMGITPRQYAESRRLNQFKSKVKGGTSITDAMYDAGYGSSRGLYEKSSERLGMTPGTYGRGGRGMRALRREGCDGARRRFCGSGRARRGAGRAAARRLRAHRTAAGRSVEPWRRRSPC